MEKRKFRKVTLLGVLALLFRRVASAFGVALSPMLAPWYGTIPGAAIGCGGLLALAVAVLLAVLYFAPPHGHRPQAEAGVAAQIPDTQALTESPNQTATPNAETYLRHTPSNRDQNTLPVRRPDFSASNKNPSEPLDEAKLQADRLQALANGNMGEYNRLINSHRALYAQHGISTCASGFFPQGCSPTSPTGSWDGNVTAVQDDFSQYKPPPKELPGFPGAWRDRPKTRFAGGKRARWRTADGDILEWDYQHGRVEKYNKRGKHQGEFDPDTGQQTKPKNEEYEVEP